MDKWVFSSDKIYKREEIAALADSNGTIWLKYSEQPNYALHLTRRAVRTYEAKKGNRHCALKNCKKGC
jgi:hypothetical protein